MSKGEIITDKDNPYIVKNTTLTDSRGNILKTNCTYSLCRCGKSENKPFCDGTHNTNGFKG